MTEQGEAVPEFYVDAYEFNGSPYTVLLSFSLAVPGEQQPTSKAVVRLRMSPEHAKVMSILFKRAVKLYEQAIETEIAIPPGILQQHEIDLRVDWT